MEFGRFGNSGRKNGRSIIHVFDGAERHRVSTLVGAISLRDGQSPFNGTRPLRDNEENKKRRKTHMSVPESRTVTGITTLHPLSTTQSLDVYGRRTTREITPTCSPPPRPNPSNTSLILVATHMCLFSALLVSSVIDCEHPRSSGY